MTGTSLVLFERIEIVPALFDDKAQVDDVLEHIRREARAQKIDISTKEGREACASLAYKIARSKTALDDMGKDLVSALKAQTGAVDAERKRIRDSLDALRDEIRAPLTQWETREKQRVADLTIAVENIGLLTGLSFSPALDEIDSRLAQLTTLETKDWQEFYDRAREEIGKARQHLQDIRAMRVKQIAEEEELARLRAEEAERKRLADIAVAEAEKKRIADAAAEKARLEAEAAAKAEQEKRDAEAKAEQERLATEARAAEKRAADEALARQEAEHRAAESERLRLEAEAKAQRDAEEAAENGRQAEIQRQADEKRRVDEETAKREANRKHRAKINNEALQAIAAFVGEKSAREIVTAIAKGDIPHTKILY